MKERIWVFIQGIAIGLFGILCFLRLGFKEIGTFFCIVGIGIALTGVFGSASNSVDE